MTASAPEWPKRLYLLDLSRGLAALAVVLWHWQHFAYAGDRPPASFDYTAQPLYPLLRLFYEHGYWAVDYFFGLSGFVFFWLYRDALAARTVSLRQFCVQRFSRLYPLHVATLVLVAVLQAIYRHYYDTSFVYPQNDAYHFLLNLGFIQLWGWEYNWSFNGPASSVSIEILLYAVFFVLAVTRLARPTICLGLALLSWWLWQGAEWHHGLFRGLASFLAGGLAFGAARGLTGNHRRLIPVLHGVTLLAWTIVLTSVYFRPLLPAVSSSSPGWTLVRSALPVWLLFPITLISLVLLEVEKKLTLRSLAGLGDLTYAIYLLHFPLQLGAMLLVGAYGGLGRDLFIHPGVLIVFLACLLGLAYVTFHGFERPLQNYLRGRWS